MQSFLSKVLAVGLLGTACLTSLAQVSPPAPTTAPAPPVVPFLPPAVPPPPVPAPNSAALPNEVVAWDANDKATNVTFGEPAAQFTFALTNVSKEPVTIVSVHTSCGCTTAQLPPMPWKLDPGANGEIHINMNLAGKSGTVIKSITVATDKGTKFLLVRTIILPLASSASTAPGMREQNMMLARADRQAVFKGDCASCHAEPAKNKQGKELYAAVCGVCHEAEHRASMVPDLHIAKTERNEDYWRNWITHGKEGSLMPAFAQSAGGILTPQQIDSLVAYLAKAMPAKPVTTQAAIRPRN